MNNQINIHNRCLSTKELNDKVVEKCKEKIDKSNTVKGESFHIEIVINKCKYFSKIIPIWNQKWRTNKKLKNLFSDYVITNGKKVAYNQYLINKVVSTLSEKMVSYNFIKTHSICKTNNLTSYFKKKIKLDNFFEGKQNYYIITQPKLYDILSLNHNSYNIFINQSSHIVFQLGWSLFVTYKLFNFIHGDILYGRDNNILLNIFKFDNVKFAIYKYKNHIWKFRMNKSLYPCIILFDFDYSEFQHNNYKIHSKAPFKSIINYPPGDKKTIDYKRQSDIIGLNRVLRKIGIRKRISLVECENSIELILDSKFNNFKINAEKYKRLLKNSDKLLIFDFDNFFK